MYYLKEVIDWKEWLELPMALGLSYELAWTTVVGNAVFDCAQSLHFRFTGFGQDGVRYSLIGSNNPW